MMRAGILVLVFACGRSEGGAAHPVTPARKTARPPAPAATAAPPAEDPTAACAALVDHLVAIQLAERNVPAAEQPTAAEREAIRGDLRSHPACRDLTEPAVRCAMAAATTAELEICYRTK